MISSSKILINYVKSFIQNPNDLDLWDIVKTHRVTGLEHSKKTVDTSIDLRFDENSLLGTSSAKRNTTSGTFTSTSSAKLYISEEPKTTSSDPSIDQDEPDGPTGSEDSNPLRYVLPTGTAHGYEIGRYPQRTRVSRDRSDPSAMVADNSRVCDPSSAEDALSSPQNS